jgi:hypothetical protein
LIGLLEPNRTRLLKPIEQQHFAPRENKMSRHNEMPPIPPGNRSPKGTGDHSEANKDTSKGHQDIQNSAEQGDTANIKQNTTNAGFFKGRRVK